MAKLTLTDLANLTNETTAVAAINANNALIETALEKTLSRDGTSPNQMEDDLDLNSKRIINLAAPVNPNDAARLIDCGVGGDPTETAVTAAATATAQAAIATAAATAAETALDSFSDVYLGPFATDPTLDNDGDALTAGMLYWDTANSVLKVHDGVDWVTYAAAAPSSAEYIVKTSDGSLSAERVLTDTTSIVWDWATGGQAKGDVQFGTTAGTAAEGDDTRIVNAVQTDGALADVEMTANSTPYWNNSNVATALALGAANTVLASTGTTSAPAYQTLDTTGAVVKAGNQNLTGGWTQTSYALTWSGTVTPSALNGCKQHATNNAAVTVAIPANPSFIEIELTNGATASVPTTSAYHKVTGDTLDATNGSVFLLTISKASTKAVMNVTKIV